MGDEIHLDVAPGTDAVTFVSRLYESYASGVYSLALRMLRNSPEAEDVTQEVFLQAWLQRDRYDPARGTLSAWILMLARSRALDRLRARRSRGGSADSGVSPDPDTLSSLPSSASDDVLALRQSMASLSAEERIRLELSFFDGYTHPEIARMLGEPLGTVKTRIRAALLGLRHALGRAERPQCTRPARKSAEGGSADAVRTLVPAVNTR